MRRLFVAVAVAVAALLAVTAAPVGAVHQTGSSFTVQLAEDGDATVTVEESYNLTNESERAAFEALRSNESRRQQQVTAFANRLERGATTARNATGRDVRAGEVTITATAEESTGVVRLRGSWTNVAAVNTRYNILELREPFASGFAVDRTLVVKGPDGYVRATTHPSPSRALKSSAYWGADADLSEFFARFEGPSPTPAATAQDGTPTVTAAPLTGEGLSALSSAAVLALVPALAVAFAIGRVSR